MKLSETPSKIIGVALGEAAINLIRMDAPPLKVKFALLTKEGESCGFMEVGHDWSEKVMEAMRVFTTVLEEEVLGRITDQPTAPADEPPEARNEPPQF